MADTRIQHGHQIQRLHNVRAIMAGERNESFKVKFTRQRLNLLDDRLFNLGRMTARLQQRQHQRSKFMPHRQTSKTNSGRVSRAPDGEGRSTCIRTVMAYGHPFGQCADLVEHGAHFHRSIAVIERGDEFDRALEAFKIRLELGFDGVVKHGSFFLKRIDQAALFTCCARSLEVCAGYAGIGT